jgi:hypothetical protein
MLGFLVRAVSREAGLRRGPQSPPGLEPVIVALLVPERHRIWHAGVLWNLANLEAVPPGVDYLLHLVDDHGRTDRLRVVYDRDVSALDLRPDSDAVAAFVPGARVGPP